jgi:hypothetical protein
MIIYFVVDRWKIIENVYSTMLSACLPVCLPACVEAEVASGALLTLLLKLGNFHYALKLSVKSPSLSPPVPSAFTLVPSFSGICKVRKFL